jgi:hypothetical protein
VQAIIGRLVRMDEDHERHPLEHLALSIEGLRSDLSWRSGLDGEFYLENIPAGRHELRGSSGEGDYLCHLWVPASDEAMIDIEEVICEAAP